MVRYSSPKATDCALCRQPVDFDGGRVVQLAGVIFAHESCAFRR
ncbi:MAG: hypothetical protein ACKVT1_09655 [Dehalococcoidia bacterium]